MFADLLDNKIALHLPLRDAKRVLLIDNASRKWLADTAIKELGTKSIELRFLSINGTYLCQPADSFNLRKVKTLWRKMWDGKKMKMFFTANWIE